MFSPFVCDLAIQELRRLGVVSSWTILPVYEQLRKAGGVLRCTPELPSSEGRRTQYQYRLNGI